MCVWVCVYVHVCSLSAAIVEISCHCDQRSTEKAEKHSGISLSLSCFCTAAISVITLSAVLSPGLSFSGSCLQFDWSWGRRSPGSPALGLQAHVWPRRLPQRPRRGIQLLHQHRQADQYWQRPSWRSPGEIFSQVHKKRDSLLIFFGVLSQCCILKVCFSLPNKRALQANEDEFFNTVGFSLMCPLCSHGYFTYVRGTGAYTAACLFEYAFP